MLVRLRLLTVVPAMVVLMTAACIPLSEGVESGSGIEGPVDVGENGDTEAGDRSEAANNPAGIGRAARLVRVIDGDSLELELDGVTTEVRLLGINAPELFQPVADGPDVRTCNGTEATDALAELLEARSLTLVGEEEDRFGRLLAEVYTEGRSVTAALVEQGWALARSGEEDLRDRMKQAASEGVGMWGAGCGVPVADGLSIGETQINPPGPDGDRLEEEWVSIVNGGPDTVDLSGWEIRDDTTSNRFVLRATIDPGQTVRIRTGSGSSSGDDVYLGEQFPVWSNGGETVVLTDPTGVVAAWAFIDGS